MITMERAKEIMQQAQALTTYGPWSDQLDSVLTPEEKKEINLHWSALPSDTSFVDAFNNFRYGRTGEAG